MFIETQSNNTSLAMRRPIYGVGINDANYITNSFIGGKHEICPYYDKWYGMLTRCYSKKYQKRTPSYIGCSVTSEWLTFSKFKSWMKNHDWQNKELDKDLLVQGNKIYSPDTCLFVSQAVNSLFSGRPPTGRKKGVSWVKKRCKFHARITVDGKIKGLGYFDDEVDASRAYINAKHKYIVRIANEQTDYRAKAALLDRSTKLLEVK